MKFAVLPNGMTSSHFRQRARHYRLAAAIADARRDVVMFGDLAMMFERLADSLDRSQGELSKVSVKRLANCAQ